MRFLLCALWAFGTPVFAAADLQRSLDGPVPVGTMMSWSASMAEVDEDPSAFWYRFRVRRVGQEFRTIRDYGPLNWIEWTASDREGLYEMEASVRHLATGRVEAAAMQFQMLSRVVDGEPAVHPTGHPLVWLYSAPACPAGNRMSVEWRSPDGVVQRTPGKACREGESMNFYLGGMRARTEYRVRHTVHDRAGQRQGPELSLVSGEAEVQFTGASAMPDAAPPEGFLLYSPLNRGPLAIDFSGNVVWYYAGYVSKLTRPVDGGTFVGLVEEPVDHAEQLVREFDLAGMTLRETNVARVNEQLKALGRRPITTFHHEARALADGKLLVLASVEQVLPDVQGPGPVNVIGDAILVLDRDLQVVWTWDSFDHMDVRRRAILNEVCVSTPTGSSGGCPMTYLDARGNDWLHGNSVQLAPDGNLVFSIRHQDWIVKIDYANGTGTGAILWRLGVGGDFHAESDDPYPWFSHQHDAEFEDGRATTLIVFDNGNTRRAANPTANSRGQVIELDEANRVARFTLNADLGAYSAALGSARRLPNGNFQFDLGFLPDASSVSAEVDAGARVVYAFRAGTLAYRVFRMRSLYAQY